MLRQRQTRMANLFSQWLSNLSRQSNSNLHQNLQLHSKYMIFTHQRHCIALHVVSYADQSTTYGSHFCSLLLSASANPTFRTHARIHSKKHHCNIDNCRQAFSFAKDLRRHCNAKHGIGEKVYCKVADCLWSQKGFSRMDILQRHLRRAHGIS